MKAEGRRQKAEGRRQEERYMTVFSFIRLPSSLFLGLAV
jgi:hypothetical protein